MGTFSYLPLLNNKDFIITQLTEYGYALGYGNPINYTTSEDYKYIIVSGTTWYNNQTAPNSTCSKGTNIYTEYDNASNQRLSVKIWKDVDSGALIEIPKSNINSGRWSWNVIGINLKPGTSSSYIELDYLESDGNAYINAGFQPNGNTRFECKWNSLRTDKTNNLTVFGARQDWNKNQVQLSDYNSSGVVGYYGYSDSSGANWTTLNYVGNYDLICSHLGTTFYRDNDNGVTSTIANKSFSVGKDMYVFALNNNGSVGERQPFRLYYLKFYDGSTLIRNFVPAQDKKTGTYGLYDKLNNQFYGNFSKDGSFTGGNI